MKLTDKINAYNVDCMEFMKDKPDNYYELAIIDVPYGINESGQTNKTRGKLAISKDYGNKNWDKEAPNSDFFDLLLKKSKNQIIFGANHFIDNFSFNVNSSCWIVWDKINGKTDFADCELAWTSFNTAVRKFSFRWQGMLQGDMKEKQLRIHPTEKPIQLYKWLLKNYAKSGDKILDTHGGSMSIAIACHYMGFELDICELDKEYFNSAIKRFKENTRQIEMF